MRTKIQRTAILFLLVLMLSFSMIPAAAFAFDDEISDIVSNTIQLDWNIIESEDLFAGYVHQTFYGDTESSWGVLAKAQLDENEQLLYTALKTKIEAVALGDGASTITEISGEISENFTNDTIDQSMGRVLDALLHDCPYEFYWLDKKTSAASYRYSYHTSSKVISNLSVTFPVAASYQADNYSENNPVIEIEKVSKAINAAKNAMKIVNEYESFADYDKLIGYCGVICELVSYNHEAVSGSYTGGYGDPWQMIYVFDGDDSTKVVCEGYSKAFQYLCDMSTFENDVYCYSIPGVMRSETGDEGHMWNIVSINGESYLVDVTNCDEGTIGANYNLFLRGAEGNISTGYTVNLDEAIVEYLYDPDTIDLWGDESDSILELSRTDYDPLESDGDSDSESDSTIKQLAAPTNLKWNVNAQGKTDYGYISWDTVDNCEGEYTIVMYKNGECYKLPDDNTSIRNYVGIHDDTAYLDFRDLIFETGTYTFSVQAMGDGVNSADSNLAYSGEYVYTRPAKALGITTELKWVGTDCYWKAVDGAAYYTIYYYKEDRKIGTSFGLTNNLSIDDGWVYLTDNWLFNLIDRTENGAGKYSFKVQAYSDDITVIANGGVSELSPATDISLQEIENGAGGNTIYLKGDANLDNKVNMDDVVALLNHVVKAKMITDPNAITSSEVTNDTELNMDDVVKLLNYVVKDIESLD